MNVTSCTIGINDLAAELLTIPLVHIKDGSGASHMQGPEHWIHGLSMLRIREGSTYPYVTQAVTELRERVSVGRTVQIMVNKLASGGELAAHRDGYPDHARYHLPVITNPSAYWWDEHNGLMHMRLGEWYGPVPYCGVLHSAGNPGPGDRYHLIVDFQKGT